jgi:tetratricopeptide (TPR) repeat protein
MRSEVLLGWVLGLSGEVQDAVGRIQEGLGGKTDVLSDLDGLHKAEAEINLAGFLIQAGRYPEAVDLLDRIRQEEPGLAVPDYLRGLAYFHLGDAFSAATAFQSAMRKDGSIATANDYLHYVWAIDKLGRTDEAKKTLQKAVERFPMTPGFYLNLGLNAEARDATSEAYCHFQMETLVGGEDSLYTGQARIRIARVEERARVSTFMDEDLKRIVRYVQLRALSSADEKEEKELDQKADRILTRLRTTELAEHPFLMYLVQERLLELGETDEAIGLLETATARFPGQVLFEIDLAKAYGQVGESTKAAELLERTLMTQPHHWKVQEAVGPGAFSRSER